MRNSEYVKVTQNIERVLSITCNKCGETYEPDDEHEFLHIHKVGVDFQGHYNHYRSKCWQFELCDKCLIDLVKTFKYAPDWFKGNRREHAQKEFDKWVNEGCKPMSRF